MKRFAGMTILALALMTTACTSMGHKHGCCCGDSCSMEKHDAQGCKDGKCSMHDKKTEEKKTESK